MTWLQDRQGLTSDALLAAALFAVQPVPVLLRGGAGPQREQWLALVQSLLPADTPWRKVPASVSPGQLLGGLDLAATLQSGRAVAERGILAAADGGVILVSMAERLNALASGVMTSAMDCGEVIVERDGLARRSPARFSLIALDESCQPDESVPSALDERLVLRVDLAATGAPSGPLPDVNQVRRAQRRLAGISVSDDIIEALNLAATSLGIGSMRPVLAAVASARAAAAWLGKKQVDQECATIAARLVLAPRALVAPQPPEAPEENQEAPPPQSADAESRDPDSDGKSMDADKELDEVVIAAAQAAIPPDLLNQLQNTPQRGGRGESRFGSSYRSRMRGRPVGARRGNPADGSRLHVIQTLRAAAPWQRLRKSANPNLRRRIEIRGSDFRVHHYRQKSQTTTIFVVDASGSAAANRLAEAKGAVELMLADCYVRRDRVAMIAFRGKIAELVLPPTSSLVRVKRSLARMPAGGGTPLASSIDAACGLAEAVRRDGVTPTVVLMTDGRANVTRDGTGHPQQAAEEALDAAGRFRGLGHSAVVIDVSPRPRPVAESLAATMGARYLPLPFADASAISDAVRSGVH
ncbi:MAG: magnesium chelatase subunit D [Xanthomonadales bacterium]|nr:magnesium chelatase subunit D [Xanthomonadales bacterium]